MAAIKTRIKIITYLNSGTVCYYGQANIWWWPFWMYITECEMNLRVVQEHIDTYLMKRSTKTIKYLNYP